jgi:tetratricopeptide (TPR) repeat protein
VPNLRAELDSPESAELFISYASSDFDRAATLHTRLVAAGFSVWFDKARLNPGCDWHKEVEHGCEAARVILPLLTPHWGKSEWTKYETYVSNAVIPVLAEGVREGVMPPPLRRLHDQVLDPLTADDAVWEVLFAAIRGKLAEPVPERVPRILDLPYAANPFFTGRDADLVRIHEELHEGPVAALTQARVRALAAMGGVGKTTLANEYARRFWRLYPQILWVDARAGLESGFALLFGKLFPGRAAEELKQGDKARLALAELSGQRDRLLVIDNVEDAETVRPWLPRDATTGCRTLITSRFSDFPAAAGIRSIPLNVLEPEPSRRFLLARSGRMAEGAELGACDNLALALGYLPLALEQAAAYIAAPGADVGFADYLRLYEAAAADLLARKALGSTEYPDAVITTWQTTVAKLSTESRAVLRLCAWYADTPIPGELVIDGAREVLALAERFGPVAQRSGATATELRMRDALTGLARYSMILDTTGKSFRVHGLVQTVERVRDEEEGHAGEACDQALARLAAIFPDAADDPSVWPLCRQLLPHLRSLMAHLAAKDASDVLWPLVGKGGRFLLSSGEAAGALPFLRQALGGADRLFGPLHPDTLASTNNLASCMRALGDAAGALPLYRRALNVQERVIGAEHPNTLLTVNNLAACLESVGDAAEALPLCRRALEGQERVLGLEHPNTLLSMNNLGNCLRALGDPRGALPVIRRALEGRERVLGREHPDTLITVSNLGECLQEVGDRSGALPVIRRALQGRERVLGPEHRDTLVSVSNLAGCLLKLGDAAGAAPMISRALEGYERLLGPEHPYTLTCINNLAYCLRTLGDASGAFPLYRRALEGQEHVLGAEHPETLMTVNNLADCLDALGDAAGAVLLSRRALAGRERTLGPEHPNTLIIMHNLAYRLQALSDASGALPLYRRALEGYERLLGPEHRDTLACVNNLAGCLLALGETADALPLFRRVADGRDRLLGPDHSDSRTARANCDCIEREVAAARDKTTSSTPNEKTEVDEASESYWRRLFLRAPKKS